MKIVIRWNSVFDNERGHRTTVIEHNKNKKTSAELLVGWLTANNRKLEDVVIHDVSVNSFAQSKAGKNSRKNVDKAKAAEMARKAALARWNKN